MGTNSGMNTASPREATIIGAGIIGLSTAIWLQRAGWRVTVIDKGDPAAAASYGNGGILAACSVVPVTVPGLWTKAPRMLLNPNEPLFMRWRYLPRLAPWLVKYLACATAARARATAQAIAAVTKDSLRAHQELAAGTGAEGFVHASDYLFLYRDRAHYEGDAFGWGLRAEAGYRWDTLDRADVAAADPAVGPDIGFATKLGRHGYISDPGAYIAALTEHVVQSGGHLVTAAVTDILSENGHVTGVVAGGQTLPATTVVLAAGAWSRPLAKRMGVTVPLESERGYHIDLWEPSVTLRQPVMVVAGKFVMTPMEGRLRVAGIVELGGLEAPPSEAPFDLLLKGARAVLPGLTYTRAEKWIGHRPAPANSVPVIGAAPALTGAYMGFGHHHIGLTAGPTTGRMLADLITGKGANNAFAAHSPERYQ